MKLTANLNLCILLPLFAAAAMAAPAIGVATGTGTFTLDSAHHQNNATIFDGNHFDSGANELELRLNGGTTMHLGTSTRGEVYRNRVLLKDGGGDIRPGTDYGIEALNLRIKSLQQDGVARVVVEGGQLRVGALRGAVQVSNERGVLLAKISQGDADSFTPQSSTAASASNAASAASAGAAGGAAAGAAAGTAGAAAATGAVAAGTASAVGISTGVIVAGVAVAGAGAAAGIAVGVTSGSGSGTISPTAR